jgi:hypothetical protein
MNDFTVEWLPDAEDELAAASWGKHEKERPMTSGESTELIDHARLLQMLTDDFPEVPHAFNECVKGLLHCEMGVFARLTDEAIGKGRYDQVTRYFDFVDRVRRRATPEVENAIDVSYIEYFALDELTEQRYHALKRLAPPLRQVLLEIDGRGRWA